VRRSRSCRYDFQAELSMAASEMHNPSRSRESPHSSLRVTCRAGKTLGVWTPCAGEEYVPDTHGTSSGASSCVGIQLPSNSLAQASSTFPPPMLFLSHLARRTDSGGKRNCQKFMEVLACVICFLPTSMLTLRQLSSQTRVIHGAVSTHVVYN
jgi:hypothetical protein